MTKLLIQSVILHTVNSESLIFSKICQFNSYLLFICFKSQVLEYNRKTNGVVHISESMERKCIDLSFKVIRFKICTMRVILLLLSTTILE